MPGSGRQVPGPRATSGRSGGAVRPFGARACTPAPVHANGELTFRRPATWKAYPFRWAGELHFHPALYLSTQPVRDPCRTNGAATVCTWPVRRLRPGGVLVVWEDRGFPGWTLATTPGRPSRVGGRSAKRATTTGGACSAIGGDRTIEVAIASPENDNWTQVTACLRGPGLARNERRLDSLLESTRFASQ